MGDSAGEDGRPSAWALGDLQLPSTGQVIVAERLCEACDLRARERVLDVGTGSGNAAIAAARRRCQVTAVDPVPAVLERARARAEAERLKVDFQEGSAEHLSFPGAAFDCVLSTFGVIFCEDATTAARELQRVTRPAGRIGFTAWTEDGFTGRVFQLIDRWSPDGPSYGSIARWARRSSIDELFPGGHSVRVEESDVRFRSDSRDAYLGFYRRSFGPTLRLLHALRPIGRPPSKRSWGRSSTGSTSPVTRLS